MAEYILENESFRAVLDTHGCELISVVRKSDGREFIWNAEPSVWKRHTPVLFPLIGKYKNNTSIHNGKAYEMGQHGFARDMEFTPLSADKTSVSMKLTQSEATKTKYPFDFELICSYKLEGNVVTAGWEVKNPGEETMYFSIGGHPAFVGTGDTLSDAAVYFETEKGAIDYSLITGGGLMGRATYPLALDENKCAGLCPGFFDKDALIVEHDQCHTVGLVENGERFVTVRFDAPVFGVWSAAQKNVPFVCIEPWYGRTDADDFDGELKDREWNNVLKSGETFTASYSMTFGA